MSETELLVQAWELVKPLAVFYAAAVIVASFVINALPLPTEITWRPYVIFYHVVQRLSWRARRPWNNSSARNNSPEKHIG